jgi:hypothetical protein
MTYTDIKQQVAVIIGVQPGSVRDCWIADVKRERGELRGPAPNRGKGRRAPTCPASYRQAIRQVLDAESEGHTRRPSDCQGTTIGPILA